MRHLLALLFVCAAWAEKPADERAEDLIRQLTLEEKAGQMLEITRAIPRLGIPSYSWWSECIHGVGRAGRATVFPAAIGLAATWNADLMHEVATVISDEARAKYFEAPGTRYHGLTYWAPALDLARDPRWGRVEETYGEDPHLVGTMGLAMVRGLQGQDPQRLKVAATLKHFAVHSQETDRHSKCFEVSERLLHEYYLAPFQKCFTEGKAASVMTAYSGFNGLPSTMNRWLLTDLLRDTWGFDGAVVTDWGAPRHLRTAYKFVPTDEHGVAAALRAGVDVLCQHEQCEQPDLYNSIIASVRLGILSEAELDVALCRSLTLRYRLGLFDPPVESYCIAAPSHIALARRASREAIVLLKNAPIPGRNNPTPLLPLRQFDSIAVIGSHANRVFLGNYSGEAPAVTTYQGITNHVGDRVVVRHVPWLEIDDRKKKNAPLDEQKRSIDEAVRAARLADVAVVVLGLNPRIETEGRDRQDLDLPKDQQELIEKVIAVNPATVVVLINGSPIALRWMQARVPAVVEAWYPGEQGGHAIADVLFGDYNPAGRLPITFPAALEQLPALDNHDITVGRTYMYMRDTPLYPFGHGLSYTKFEYTNLRFDGTNATVAVTNTGDRDGDEVVQLYVHTTAPPVIMPFRQLRAFRRIHIPRGATRTVSLPVTAPAYWDETRHAFVVAPGLYELQVGASSEDIRLKLAWTHP